MFAAAPVVLLSAVLLATLAVLTTTAADAWIVHYHRVPPMTTLTVLAAGVATSWCLRRARARGAVDAVLAVILLAVYVTAEVEPLGDHARWRLMASSDTVAVSELLSTLVNRLAFRIGGERGLGLVAPCCGAAFSLLVARLLRRWCVAPGQTPLPTQQFMLDVMPLTWGCQLMYFRGYVENTQFAMLTLLGLAAAALRLAEGSTTDRMRVVAAAVWAALAVLAHAQYVALLPAIPIAMAHRKGPDALRRGLVDCLLFVAFFGAVVVGCAGLLHALGFVIDVGHIDGGGDHRLFVRLQPDPTHVEAMVLFSPEHRRLVAGAIFASAPILVSLPVMLLRMNLRRPALAAARRSAVASWLALGFVGFATLFEFDLRFPFDADLMLGMGCLVGIALAAPLFTLACQAPRLTGLLLLLAGAHTWLLIGSLLVTDPLPIRRGAGEHAGMPGTAEAPLVLKVNGHADLAELRPGERLIVALELVQGRDPVPFALFGHRGLPDAVAGELLESGERLAFPVQGAGDRVFLLANNLPSLPMAAVYPSTPAPWIGSFLPPPRETIVLQAVFLGPGSQRRGTNPVVVRGVPDLAR